MDQERTAYWRDAETITQSTRSTCVASEPPTPGLTILSHPDVGRIGETSTLVALVSGHDALLSRLEPVFAMPGEMVRRPLADRYLSRHPIRLVPCPGNAVRLIAAGTRTRLSVDGEVVTDSLDVTPRALERGVVLVLAKRIVLLLHVLAPEPGEPLPGYGLVGESRSIVDLRRDITRVASLDVSALIRGETGTGKELVAQAIHQASPRCHRAFLAVNMGAVPAELAAAELFGAAKGAFTGSHRHRTGYFTRARGGTLFLDEIAETPPEVQVMLLRALENRRIQPLGADEEVEVDVRILSATDADLESHVEDRSFRSPLLHRLSEYEIRLPPLRERREDLGRLLLHFLRPVMEEVGEAWRLENQDEPWLRASVVARLAACSWPGNIRQLRNVVRQLVIASRGAAHVRWTPSIEKVLKSAGAEEIRGHAGIEASSEVPRTAESQAEPAGVPDLPGSAPDLPDSAGHACSRAKFRPVYRSPSDVDEDELLCQLRAHGFRLQPSAAALGISRTSLYALIEKSRRVRKARDLTREDIEQSLRRHGDLDVMAQELEVSRKGLRRRMTELGFE